MKKAMLLGFVIFLGISSLVAFAFHTSNVRATEPHSFTYYPTECKDKVHKSIPSAWDWSWEIDFLHNCTQVSNNPITYTWQP